MSKLSGSGLLLAGIFLIFLGILIRSDILETLLDIFGFLVIVLGAILGLVGLIQFFTGRGRSKSSSDF